ncbi:MAG TPA: RES family NAD+ phosphorylase [Flavobacteriaceae bacterium]|nr:RES family NAD+ phosphorylase [Flavobacteriaceae bacterium]
MRYYSIYENLPTRSPLGFGPGAGRWNHAGIPIIYASNIATLPFMELYSIKGPVVAKSKWILAILEIPDEIPVLEIDSLPADWNKRPPANSTKDFGTHWANSKNFLCIKVPSARIPLLAFPAEHNLLINPLHPSFYDIIKVVSEENVCFEID